ncbi:MAG: DUF4286 family protein [Tenacibaculum sp.]|nr:DUF4286 family protein [Tenacibaculum sp.]
MYIYNVTVNIDETAHDEWLVWIKDHIKKVLETGCFKSAKMTQVLIEEEMGGVTYSIQYRALSKEDLQSYLKNYSLKLQNKGVQKFADKMLSFKTELKIIEEFFHHKDK